MKLIADSGSTKTDWCLTVEGREVARYSTQGINPFQQDEKTIAGILTHELFPQMGTDYNVSEVFFYGAGCRDEVRPTMIKILTKVNMTILDFHPVLYIVTLKRLPFYLIGIGV